MGISAEKPEEGPPKILILISLVVQNYIHRCKCKGKIPNDKGLIKNIESIIKKMELGIATQNGENTVKSHSHKWVWMK